MASTFKETVSHVVCKYSFLVLVFSFFTALQVGLLEPAIKKMAKVGDPEEHVIKTGDILVKGMIFFVGMMILFTVFKDRLVKCATGM